MRLVTFWFIVIAVLWTGFFILEGFDFGVGMLHVAVSKDEAGRRAAINTIGYTGRHSRCGHLRRRTPAARPGPRPARRPRRADI